MNSAHQGLIQIDVDDNDAAGRRHRVRIGDAADTPMPDEKAPRAGSAISITGPSPPASPSIVIDYDKTETASRVFLLFRQSPRPQM
jgi:hypothetical protein